MKALDNNSLFTEISNEESVNVNGGDYFPGWNAPLISDPYLAGIIANDPLLSALGQNPIFGSVLTWNPAGPVNMGAYYLGYGG